MAQSGSRNPGLTRAQLQILLALADGERHGYAIMRRVADESGGRCRLGPGTLYGAIKTLLEHGCIRETESRADPDMGDERRKYYELSASGRRALAGELRAMAELVDVGRDRRVLPVAAPKMA